eukprot:3433482-Alexandrium_andersonii.AAC.1
MHADSSQTDGITSTLRQLTVNVDCVCASMACMVEELIVVVRFDSSRSSSADCACRCLSFVLST